jgi:predicted N-acetyltransferase YhbS
VLRQAFAPLAISDQSEHLLVARLRRSVAFIPELSLVAEIAADCGAQIVGHILSTRLTIRDEDTSFPSLALAPLAVEPAYQKRGIGGALITESHCVARKLGFASLVVLGHASYYPRFGYEAAERYDVRAPFRTPPGHFQICVLDHEKFAGTRGTAVYPPEFFDR